MQQIVLGMDGTSQYFSRFRLKLYKIGKHMNMLPNNSRMTEATNLTRDRRGHE